MVLSVALVDAMIKDSDIVAVGSAIYIANEQIFRAVHQLLLSAVYNPFLSLPPSFKAVPDIDKENSEGEEKMAIRNTSIPGSKMFATGAEEIEGSWLEGNEKFMRGITKLGEVLNGGR